MSDEQLQSANSNQEPTTPGIGPLIQQRALIALERANAKPYRSPRRIILTVLAVMVTMTLFLTLMDAGVKVTHRVIDIWAPVIFDTQKVKPLPLEIKPPPQDSSASSSEAAYMIKVVPLQSSSASSQRAK